MVSQTRSVSSRSHCPATADGTRTRSQQHAQRAAQQPRLAPRQWTKEESYQAQASRTQMGARDFRGAPHGRHRPVRLHVRHHERSGAGGVRARGKNTVYYSDGTTEIGSYAEQNREIIDCSVLPDYVGNAIVSSEDRSFYTNKGIDLVGIARALYNNLTTGSRQGGSNHHPAVRGALLSGRDHIVFRQAPRSVPGHQDRATAR